MNGLRGLAIAAVVWHHECSWWLSPHALRAPRWGRYFFGPAALASNGWLGVNLFFVLSGFVLARPYAASERHIDSFADARAFYVHRARRLLPLYWLVVLVGMLVRVSPRFGSHAFLMDVFRLLTFTFTFDPRTFFPPYDSVLWSLAVEVHFSLLFPLLVVAWRRFGIARLLGLALVGCLAVRIYDARHMPTPFPLALVKDSLAGRLDDFVVGMAVAAWFERRREFSGRTSVALLCTGLLLVTLCAIGWENITFARLPFVTAAFLGNFANTGFGLILVALLAAPPRAVARVFALPPLQLLGMMSYSVYVWHTMGIDTVRLPHEDVVGYLAVVLALSALTYRFVEFPRESVRRLFTGFPEIPQRTTE